MTAQDTLARDYLAKVPGRETLHKRIAELSYYDAVSPPVTRAGRFFFSRRHADKEKSIIYWKQGEDGAEKVLIDPNTLSPDGSIALGGWWPSYDGRLLAYSLKKNNADAATLYVMAVDSGTTSEVDVIEGAKYALASWTPDNKGFYYTKLPDDPSISVADLPGHAHVRYHTLGSKPELDPLVFPATNDPRTFVSCAVSRDGRYVFASIAHGWNSTDVFVKDLQAPMARSRKVARAGKEPVPGWQEHGFEPLAVGVNALFEVRAWKGSFYVLTNYQAPRYRIFKVDPKLLAMDKWREIVPEQGDAVLEGMGIVGNHLALTYMHNAHNRLALHSLDGALVREVALPGVGSVSGMIGNPDEDDAYYLYTSFNEPSQIYRTSIKSGASSLWAELDLPVDTQAMVVEQIWYPSKDGTKISMFIIRRTDATPSGDVPVMLYGYGGFNVSLTPSFRTDAVVWLEKGGMVAIPNLRGGGEYGEDWHKAGMLLAKQNVFDDFIYAAKHLIAAGWTKPERLAIYGGSNGGLLVGAAMTQAPELFGAVVCAVPLLDMVRYHLFGSGKTWIAEYGSAEDPEQLKVLHAYSPYHRVQQGKEYPALLMLSADSDDRVDPMHARKFVAAMQWAQAGMAPIVMRIERNAGHGGADMVRQRVEQITDMIAFLTKELAVE